MSQYWKGFASGGISNQSVPLTRLRFFALTVVALITCMLGTLVLAVKTSTTALDVSCRPPVEINGPIPVHVKG